MPVLEWLEVTGFRSFAQRQRLDFGSDLALVWGPNSQGKTSIAEAIEFLLTGGTIRRELLARWREGRVRPLPEERASR
jgi:recombinational DNA repair ATPase RecF